MKQNVMHGTLYLMAAQAVFVASGYAIHVGLVRLLGPADYGIYVVVISLMTMVILYYYHRHTASKSKGCYK
jgi:stage V sporulation protein B